MHRLLRPTRSTLLKVGGVSAFGAYELQKGGCKEGTPPFSLKVPKYDQSTFDGRFYAMLDVIDPTMLLTSDAQLSEAKKKLEEFKAGTSKATDEELWAAKKTVDVMVHPVTGETMLAVGRMSAFIPMNVPIMVGMLSAQTPVQNVFWQWVNQTYNVVNNYVNRSSDQLEWSKIGQAYGIAVTAACGISVGLGQLIKSQPALQSMGFLSTYFAVVSAGASNVAFTRMDEIKSGVKIADADGNVVGISKAAGKQAVMQTVLTRNCGLPVLPIILPAVILKMSGITSEAALKAGEVVLVTMAFTVGLPAALAILPQTMEIPVGKLEPEFQNLKDKNGAPITSLFANKGL